MTYGQLEALLNKIDKYEKVLDEIREIINQNMTGYSYCIKAFDEIEEILDKVKKL